MSVLHTKILCSTYSACIVNVQHILLHSLPSKKNHFQPNISEKTTLASAKNIHMCPPVCVCSCVDIPSDREMSPSLPQFFPLLQRSGSCRKNRCSYSSADWLSMANNCSPWTKRKDTFRPGEQNHRRRLAGLSPARRPQLLSFIWNFWYGPCTPLLCDLPKPAIMAAKILQTFTAKYVCSFFFGGRSFLCTRNT